MIDETDMSQERGWFYERRARAAINNLKKRNMNARYVSSRQEAISAVMEMIPPGALVARADSVSIDQVGIVSELIRRNQNSIIDPLKRDADGFLIAGAVERIRMHRESFFADVFLTGTNAVTLDGKLVNIDGIGNRVSAMIFGPEKVIVIAGINKIVKDVNEALGRIRGFAAPMNARRHYLKHHHLEDGELPCVKMGSCVDCKNDRRPCNYTVIIERASIKHKGRINVVIVGEELGI